MQPTQMDRIPNSRNRNYIVAGELKTSIWGLDRTVKVIKTTGTPFELEIGIRLHFQD